MISRFFVKLTILLVPFLIIGGILFLFLTRSGELYYSYDQLVSAIKSKDTVLMGLAHTNPIIPVKILILRQNKFEVIALGTSRVMGFRSAFFKEGVFYNCGGCIARIKNLRNFLSRIPKENYPKLIILGLDQNFFNVKWDYIYDSDSAYLHDLDRLYSFADVVQAGILGLLMDIREYKVNLKNYNIVFGCAGYQKIGLTAFYKSDGYLNDGSYYYGSVVEHPFDRQSSDYEFRDTFARIANGNRLFEYGQEINPAAIEELDNFLEECRKNHIHVVGFLPPYAQAVHDKMKLMGDKYSYIPKIIPALSDLFHRYGFVVMDFTDMTAFGASSLEVIDGIHASEKAYLRILLELSDNDQFLRGFIKDEKYLRSRLLNSRTPFMVFSKDER